MAYDASNVIPSGMYDLPEGGAFTDANPEELMLSLRTKELKEAKATIVELKAQIAELKAQILGIYSGHIDSKLSEN